MHVYVYRYHIVLDVLKENREQQQKQQKDPRSKDYIFSSGGGTTMDNAVNKW
jgi:hypothetical protein